MRLTRTLLITDVTVVEEELVTTSLSLELKYQAPGIDFVVSKSICLYLDHYVCSGT